MSTDPSHSQVISAQVASAMPGRVRIRLDREHRQDGAITHLRDGLEREDGIREVAFNPTTGSLLVRYDREALDHDDVLAFLEDAGVVVADVAEAVVEERADFGQSVVSTNLLDALADLDGRLSRATNGLVDAKLLFPLALGALAVRQIAMNGFGLGTVPGYVLLWYTFDSFYKMHPRAQPAFTQQPDVQEAEAATEEASADADVATAEVEAAGEGGRAARARGAAGAARRAASAARRATNANASRRRPSR